MIVVMRKKPLLITNLVFIFAASVLILLSFFSYTRNNQQVQASNEVTNTQLLKFKLNDAFSHLLETESAQRGFILTLDSSFLRDYYHARKAIPALLNEIETLVSDNQQQKDNLRLARTLFDERLRFITNYSASETANPGTHTDVAEWKKDL
jgi:CHASE3 domain sensor protein